MNDTRSCDCRILCAAVCLLCVILRPVVRVQAGEVRPDDRSVAAFCDAFCALQMKELNIPGAVVVWVQDGRVRHAAGYGITNRQTGDEVDVDGTVFRIASVSKFFTALCALQLAEEGKLDLEADVNEYLPDLHIGTAAQGPVTPSRLIVHTGGFDERLLGYLTHDPRSIADLGGYLKAWMPPQTRPAGEVATYSNHGYALLGYLVERQSGMRFDAYARKRVFEPLEMRTTGFLVPPIAPNIASGLCPGYWSTGELVDPVWSRPYPAGALATTGSDMARFLIAFLEAARGEPSNVFPESVVKRLTTRHFSHRPDLPGYTLGLCEMELFGQRILLKGGVAPGHSAVISFLPEHNAGLFVAVNRQEPQFWTRLLPKLVGHAFPTAAQMPAKPIDPRPLERFAGEYRVMRYADRSFERVLSLAMHVQVDVVDRHLRLSGPDIDLLCRPTAEPLVFASEPGQYLAFRADDRGRVEGMFLNVVGEHLAAERLRFWQRTETVVISVLLACFVLVLAGSLAAMAVIWRRIKHGSFRTADGVLSRLVSGALGATIVATLVAFYWAMVPLNNFLHGPSPAIWLALTGTNLMALLAVVLMVVTGRQILSRRGHLLRRVIDLLLCASCLVLVAFLVQFSLIGYRI